MAARGAAVSRGADVIRAVNMVDVCITQHLSQFRGPLPACSGQFRISAGICLLGVPNEKNDDIFRGLRLLLP